MAWITFTALGSAVRKFQREGIVEVRMTLRNDRIVDVMPLSGPVRYFAPVRAAVKQLHCHVNEAPGGFGQRPRTTSVTTATRLGFILLKSMQAFAMGEPRGTVFSRISTPK